MEYINIYLRRFSLINQENHLRKIRFMYGLMLTLIFLTSRYKKDTNEK